jgi:hypothetical protein
MFIPAGLIVRQEDVYSRSFWKGKKIKLPVLGISNYPPGFQVQILAEPVGVFY